MVKQVFLFWFPMIVIAFSNALLRERAFMKHFSEIRSHQYSTITLMIFCAIYIWLVFPRLHIQTAKQAFVAGLIFVLLTVAFEFALGLITNRSSAYLLRDYNITAGRIWSLFLLFLLMLPWIIYSVKTRE